MTLARQILDIVFPVTTKMGQIIEVINPRPVVETVLPVVEEVVEVGMVETALQTIEGGYQMCRNAVSGTIYFFGFDALNRRIVATACIGLLSYHVMKHGKSFFQRNKERVWVYKEDPQIVSKEGVQLESVKAGSEEVRFLPKKGEIVVCGLKDDKIAPVGKAIRVYDALVMPEHVMMTAMCYPLQSLINASNTKAELPFDFSTAEKLDLETDLVSFKLTEDQWSKLAGSKVKITSIVRPTSVTILSVTGFGSHGRISNAKEFGRTEYTGTTMRGYSGSCYYQGASAVAMHLAGGNINAGYNMKYIAALVRSAYKIVPEDTADFLDALFEDLDGSLKFSESPMSPDEVFIQDLMGGFHSVPRVEYHAAMDRFRKAREHWRNQQYDDDDAQHEYERETPRYDDYSQDFRQSQNWKPHQRTSYGGSNKSRKYNGQVFVNLAI